MKFSSHPAMIIIMGVSGSGKTTIGKSLAADLHWEFADADDFHSPANIEKMKHGQPLTDHDREPWLLSLRAAITRWQQNQQRTILACSALKEQYRQMLESTLENPEAIAWVYLKADWETLVTRLVNRSEHYMKVDLLRSQVDTLEEPQDAVVIDANLPVTEIVKQLRQVLNL